MFYTCYMTYAIVDQLLNVGAAVHCGEEEEVEP
jgi:hypothetical protein